MKEQLIPVLLGADLNCYNVARAFHEAYGVVSYAFGRYAISATKYSRIIRFTAVPQMDDEEVLLKTLTDFADAHPDAKLILFACTDDYAAMMMRLKDKLPRYIAPCPPAHLLDSLSKKAEFYEICEKYGIPYPKTAVMSEPAKSDALTAETLGFPYPIVVKPSSSVAYWKHPFDGMKKVYIADTADEAERILAEIYGAGYNDKMILQEFIPGGDAHMRVLTAFSDKNGKVRAMCLGHTMIEEHTPKGLGNHAAIVTEPVTNLPFYDKIRLMLEDLGYTGFSNFDIKFTGLEDDFRIFEINLRQGRSNFYVTASGINIARLATEVYESDGNECVFGEKPHFWHLVPRSVAYTYTEDGELVKTARTLQKSGEDTSSLLYKPDLRWNPMRFICVMEILRRQKKKFKKYYPKNV
ncbi:MAG: ATP-grasp domain-containing protein [Clostridia bacterium]|nr:ATP-grasp domain-containing protein [Clostridia bacterium]